MQAQDILSLDRDYLRTVFRPWLHGFTPADMAAAIYDSPVRDELESWAEACPSYHRDLRLALEGAPPEPGYRAASNARLVAHYFWEMVYQRFPQVYARFASLQHFPLDQLFPTAVVRGRRILDVGCGAGQLTVHVARSAESVVGVDPSAGLLALARGDIESEAPAAPVELKVGSFGALPAPDGSADLIVSNMAYQANEERGGETGLTEMRRVLRPGGEIRLVVGTESTGAFLRDRGFRRTFVARPLTWEAPQPFHPEPLLRAMLEAAGLPRGWNGARFCDTTIFRRTIPLPEMARATLAAMMEGHLPRLDLSRGQVLGCEVYSRRYDD